MGASVQPPAEGTVCRAGSTNQKVQKQSSMWKQVIRGWTPNPNFFGCNFGNNKNVITPHLDTRSFLRASYA